VRVSMEWIEGRCEEDADCLLWRGSAKPGGSPVASMRIDGRNTQLQIRREVWELTRGRIPAGKFVANDCTNPRCLNHLKLITSADRSKRLWMKPDVRSRMLANMTRAARETSKMDMEKARYVRASAATLKEVAAELGISFQLASQIRRGVRWKEEGNPFAGLGA
jgi:hypothetical protein